MLLNNNSIWLETKEIMHQDNMRRDCSMKTISAVSADPVERI
jgi:hypothetical protein